MPAWTSVPSSAVESARELTVGKHAAPAGAAADPLVAAALARRAADTSGAHREGRDDDGEQGARTGPVGWPAPPAPGGGGLGWPGEGSAPAEPVASAPRRGWRRFFRSSAAA